MEIKEIANTHFLHPGGLFAQNKEYIVTTILGSCVSICLWDPVLRIGGINHYLLALWNGEGLPSPKYGNIAITKLVERILALGSKKQNLKAKVFGGATVIRGSNGFLNVSQRNITLAENILQCERIPVISCDVGGNRGRKIIFNTNSGGVLVKKIKPMMKKV